ncbi:hypothetical protein ACFL2D_02445 [Patescibacteria group bacterium]
MNLKYIDAITGSFFAFIVLSIISFMFRRAEPIQDAEIVLTISTFIFAILAGFFIQRANSRYENIKRELADEDAAWLTLYRLAKSVSASFGKTMANHIDKYYLIALDPIGITYYKETIDVFSETFDMLKKNRSKMSIEEYIYSIQLLEKIEIIRNRSSVIYGEKITRGQWTVLILLATIIIVSVFFIQTDSVFSQISSVLLSTILVLVLLILRDLSALRISGQPLMYESGQENLEAMGKLRYYSQGFFEQYKIHIPASVKEYRVGYHKPGEKKRQIKIVKNK